MLKIAATLSVAAALAAGGYLYGDKLTGAKPVQPASAAIATASIDWVAAAPGRVEPKSGEIRIGTALLGRVADVLVKVDDHVEDGELLFRLDDEEPRARLAAAEAEALARRKEKENDLPSSREDVRKAEDAVFSAERAVTGARFELDFMQAAVRNGTGSEGSVAEAKKRLVEARDRLKRERQGFVKAQSKSGLAAPNRAEASISAARAEVAIAEAVLEKTRIRASAAGTVLQLNVKAGEMVAPSPENPLVVMGDMSVVRVKAEVDESDIAKIKAGQKAFVRTVGYAGKDFEGRVTALAPTLGAPRIGPRGPRRQNDVDVLEVTIEMQANGKLMPGMRVDTFFRAE
ncbi:MAG: efflux RND transporter periplasmic adaptor subunit [Hyphomicrobium sp.]